ncbi:MAG TPA: menaquinone biosynthesis protein [Saprospiraceae bacterium]|nr:menaquinone biosynthesis protein [Saprospiraceae bacterium]
MDNKIKIALVSYLNTLPFEWALEGLVRKDKIEIIKTVPSECANLLKRRKVDLALIPSGALEDIEDGEIVTDYCIGCDGPVRSVCIFSSSSLDQINKLYLDSHSRTSHLLARIVIESFFNNSQVDYEVAHVEDIDFLEDHEAVLMIGDKVFGKEDIFRFKTDLGQVWKENTGLPFVFAVWVQRSSNPVDEILLNLINKAFEREINKILSGHLKIKKDDRFKVNLESYFRTNISYTFAKAKKMSILLFQEKVNKIKHWKAIET